MASRADNIASNLSLANFSKATELKSRIWFTLGALIVFRFLSFVPLPGINPQALASLADQLNGGVTDLLNAFTGGSQPVAAGRQASGCRQAAPDELGSGQPEMLARRASAGIGRNSACQAAPSLPAALKAAAASRDSSRSAS